jgi:hypothetical protein
VKYSAVAFVLLGGITGCRSSAHRLDSEPAASIAALRDTLIRFRADDQAGRDSIATAVVVNDTMFMRRLAHGDSVRTLWLRTHVAARGWPRRSVVGDTAAGAAWLILQHSTPDFQAQMLPVLDREVKAGEVSAADVAMLRDRVDVHRGMPQRYGTQFEVRGNRLIADSIAELSVLDSLRRAVGMPPMSEYVKTLAEMYRMPVEWPPSDQRLRRR